MSNPVKPLIVAAPDSFKGSCTALDAAKAMLAGARSVFGESAEYLAMPLADGGEGTLDALLAVWGSEARAVASSDALGRPRTARYGLRSELAVIEAAESNGLPWVADQPLRPLDADTRGVGDIILAALDDGAKEILLCIGGSATSDGGTGLMRSLGARFLDRDHRPVQCGARGLPDIAHIDLSGVDPRALSARWRIAVDVKNPPVGPLGAASVFGPQKGAGAADIAVIDAGLTNLAQCFSEVTGVPARDLLERPGLGAAGGIALACSAAFGAELVAGAELISTAMGLPEALDRAALVLTGEGSFDAQSLAGKVIDLLRRTAPVGTPIVVVAGAVQLSAAECREAGITAAFSLAQGPATLAQLQAAAITRITDTAAHACALLRAELLPAPADG